MIPYKHAPHFVPCSCHEWFWTFLDRIFSSSFDVCIRCVWGDLVKLVNLQMAGLNEQQGYVLRLTSGEGYKEERVEVGIWGLLLEDPWMVKT